MGRLNWSSRETNFSGANGDRGKHAFPYNIQMMTTTSRVGHHHNLRLVPDTVCLLCRIFPLYVISVLFCFNCFFWCPCMAINNVNNVQYNGGLLPDIILLTQCHLHRGTCLNAMKRFCICSL